MIRRLYFFLVPVVFVLLAGCGDQVTDNIKTSPQTPLRPVVGGMQSSPTGNPGGVGRPTSIIKDK